MILKEGYDMKVKFVSLNGVIIKYKIEVLIRDSKWNYFN